MTAGKGIQHSEIPMSFTEPAYGFQLWINLDAKNKLNDPRYQEFKKAEIPTYQEEGIEAKVIAGQVFGVKGPIEAVVPTYFLDFKLKKDKTYQHIIPKGWNSMVIVYQGSLNLQGAEGAHLNASDGAVLKISDVDETIKIQACDEDTGFILLAGLPIDEPIARRSNFVMNTQEECDKAVSDYREGKNGFEGVKEWNSKNKLLRLQKPPSSEIIIHL